MPCALFSTLKSTSSRLSSERDFRTNFLNTAHVTGLTLLPVDKKHLHVPRALSSTLKSTLSRSSLERDFRTNFLKLAQFNCCTVSPALHYRLVDANYFFPTANSLALSRRSGLRLPRAEPTSFPFTSVLSSPLPNPVIPLSCLSPWLSLLVRSGQRDQSRHDGNKPSYAAARYFKPL